MGIFGSLIWLVALACTIWVIYDVVTSKKKRSTLSKVVWIICALLFSIITAIIYYFVGRK